MTALHSANYHLSTLDNGLAVASYHMPHVETISISIIVGVGSRYENESDHGMSHFLEHMAFKGTDKRSAQDIAKEFDNIGGYFNAYTSRECTVYYAKILKEYYDQAIDIISDIILNSVFAQVEINKELQVILQEMAGVEDSPDEIAFEKFYQQAFPNQAFGRSILGTKENISNFASKDFQNFIQRYYRPDNIWISAAGNLDHKEFVNSIAKYFAHLNTSNTPLKKITQASYEGGLIYHEKQIAQSNIALGFISQHHQSLSKFYQANLLSMILGGGMSCRLFQKIREEMGLAYCISSNSHSYLDTGLLSIFAGTDHSKAASTINTIYDELRILLKNGITEEELSRAKIQFKSGLLMSEESPEAKSEIIGKCIMKYGRIITTDEMLQSVMSVTTEEISNIAESTFASSPCLVVVGQKPNDFDFQKINMQI